MTIKSKEKRKRNWRRAKLDLWQTNHQSPRSLHLVPKSVTARYIFSLFSELFSSREKFCSQCSSLLNPLPSLRWCHTRRFATTIFSSTKSCNIVTLYCTRNLRCDITFRVCRMNDYPAINGSNCSVCLALWQPPLLFRSQSALIGWVLFLRERWILYSTANDPQPQMIPRMDPKWSSTASDP